MLLSLCVVLVLLGGVQSQWLDDFDVVPASLDKPTITTSTVRRFEKSKVPVLLTAHVAVLTGSSTAFKVLSRCNSHTYLSDIAKDNGCTYATNGGFFVEGGTQCIGNLIENQIAYSLESEDTVVPSFGVRSSDKAYVLGNINQPSINATGFDYLISGGPWLVRNGTTYESTSMKTDTEVGRWTSSQAPRTAIGLDAKGNLVLVQVDGIEGIFIGMGMSEFADFLVSLGLNSAINLDGGGSSESFYNGKVVGYPHCHDTFTICERNIASATCLTV